MQELDVFYLCRVIGNLSGVPIRIYSDEKLTFSHSLVHLPRDPISLNWEDIRKIQGHVGYFVTEHFYYYGVIHSGSTKIVIGPARQSPDSQQELREAAFRLNVPEDETSAFVDGMRSILRMPLESILQILCTMNYVLNGEKLELADIAIYEPEQNDLNALLARQHADRVFSDFQEPAVAVEHNTYTQEQQLLHLVRKGNTAALREWIASAPAIRGGTLAADQLRQMKNTFVVAATLVSRAAIQGGLSPEEAFTLSDSYIQKCEFLNSLTQITNLQYHMVLEFTQRVERLRLGESPTQLTIAVTNYVQQHLSQPIRAEDMAKAFYMSRPYLSARFKKETGETLTDFILKEKAEEGKRLLRYSDKSVTAIAAYLGFSSLGHFSQVFKRCTGQTPKEYREKNAR